MNSEELVKRLYSNVIALAEDTLDHFRTPSGEEPAADTVHLSEFIAELSTDQQEDLLELARRIAANALMQVLYSLDGTYSVVDDSSDENFELNHVSSSGTVNFLVGESLGDIARALDTERRAR
jgi:hypothetical protein